MSILIKGMELPTGNNELRLIIHSNGQVIISHKTYYEEAEAVPVPPHGRLIDADALIADRLEFEARHYTVCDEFDKGRLAGWHDVIRAIRGHVPTIIEEER